MWEKVTQSVSWLLFLTLKILIYLNIVPWHEEEHMQKLSTNKLLIWNRTLMSTVNITACYYKEQGVFLLYFFNVITIFHLKIKAKAHMSPCKLQRYWSKDKNLHLTFLGKLCPFVCLFINIAIPFILVRLDIPWYSQSLLIH